MAKLPDDFPPIQDQALPWPQKPEQPTAEERKAFTAARLELRHLIDRDSADDCNGEADCRFPARKRQQ